MDKNNTYNYIPNIVKKYNIKKGILVSNLIVYLFILQKVSLHKNIIYKTMN